MKKKWIGILFFLVAVNIMITGCFFYSDSKEKKQDRKVEQIVAVNEIEQLIESGKDKEAVEKSEILQKDIRLTEARENNRYNLVTLCVINLCILFGVVFCIFLCPAMMEALLRGVGITNFITDYTLDVIILPICMICFCFFLFAYMVSGKIKIVEVRELVSE